MCVYIMQLMTASRELIRPLTKRSFQVELVSWELREARDQNELMEFRILELEQCQSKVSARAAREEVECRGNPFQTSRQRKPLRVALSAFARDRRRSIEFLLESCGTMPFGARSLLSMAN